MQLSKNLIFSIYIYIYIYIYISNIYIYFLAGSHISIGTNKQTGRTAPPSDRSNKGKSFRYTFSVVFSVTMWLVDIAMEHRQF